MITHYNPYRQHGGLSATTWVSQNLYKIYTILRQNSENIDINSDRLLKLAESLASSLILHPLSREVIFSNNPQTPNERIQLYEDYMSPFKQSTSNYFYSHERHNYSSQNDRPFSNLYKQHNSYHINDYSTQISQNVMNEEM